MDKQVETQEPVYTRAELLAASSVFKVRPEIVAGALHFAGKDSMTKAEAQAAITKFLKRKV